MELLEEYVGSMLFDMSLSNIWGRSRSSNKENKPLGIHPTEKLLNSKGNHSQNKKLPY